MQRKLNKPISLFVKVFGMDDETLRNVAKVYRHQYQVVCVL